jgi:hypothetical protein
MMRPAPELGGSIEVIEDAPEAERPVGRLRLLAAVACLIAAAWVVAASGGAPLSFVVVVAVLAASFFWWKRFAAVERGVVSGKIRRLTLAADGLTFDDGEAHTIVRWSDVERIELDHDRIQVLVVHRAGELSLEPPLGGLGLEGLGDRVQRAFRSGAFHDAPRRP